MKNLFKALSEFQNECPVIHKDTKGYGYTYADLPAIFNIINPILKKNGLSFTQLVNGHSIDTILCHIESGEQIESSTSIPDGVELKGMNDFQVLGSAITYIRRYAISSMLGIVTDKDTDASGEQVKSKPKKQQTYTANDDYINQAISQAESCNTFEELQAIWSYYKDLQTNESFIKAKDKMKTKISKNK